MYDESYHDIDELSEGDHWGYEDDGEEEEEGGEEEAEEDEDNGDEISQVASLDLEAAQYIDLAVNQYYDTAEESPDDGFVTALTSAQAHEASPLANGLSDQEQESILTDEEIAMAFEEQTDDPLNFTLNDYEHNR